MIRVFYTKVHQLLNTIIYNARRNIINKVLISLPNLIHMRTMICHAFFAASTTVLVQYLETRITKYIVLSCLIW